MTPTEAITALEKALEAGPTAGQWTRNAQLSGPFWNISSDHTIGGEPCKSGRQAVASVHGESRRGSKAYAAMFEANANWIAAANPLAIRTLLDAHAGALRDVERYRYLRQHRDVLLATGFFGNGCVNKYRDDVDAAIDAIRAALATNTKAQP